MSTYVLVHGSFHGGWCWEKIVPQLVRAGHHVVAVDLPGHGEDTTPIAECTLQSYVHTVLRVMESRKEPVILVGHSFGGVVVSQAAEQRPDLVKTLVYLTAMVPLDGQTAFQLVDPNSQVGPNLVLNQQEGWGFVNEAAIPFLYYTDCSPEDIAVAKAHLVKEPLAPNFEPVHLTAEKFGQVKKVYIECLNDNAVTLGFQRQLQALTPCQQIFSLASSHSPFFSHAQELAEILLKFAAQPLEIA